MEALRAWLKDTKTSQVDLADRLEVSQPTVWAWLNGRANPSAENLRKLCLLTGLSTDKLLGFKSGRRSARKSVRDQASRTCG